MRYESVFPWTELGGTARRCLAEVAELSEAYIQLVYWHTETIWLCFAEDMKNTGRGELQELDEKRAKALGILEHLLVNKISEFNTVCHNIRNEQHECIQD